MGKLWNIVFTFSFASCNLRVILKREDLLLLRLNSLCSTLRWWTRGHMLPRVPLLSKWHGNGRNIFCLFQLWGSRHSIFSVHNRNFWNIMKCTEISFKFHYVIFEVNPRASRFVIKSVKRIDASDVFLFWHDVIYVWCIWHVIQRFPL